MKKSSSKSLRHNPTTAANLEARFAAGRAVLTHGGARPGAGRKPLGKQRKTVKLSPGAIRRFEAYARRKKLPHFSAALQAASHLV